MGKSTLLATTLGALAIGARAGAVDLTEGDFDAQVFESGKVRACRDGLLYYVRIHQIDRLDGV